MSTRPAWKKRSAVVERQIDWKAVPVVDGEPMTDKEIAEKFGISRGRVNQIVQTALEKLRVILER